MGHNLGARMKNKVNILLLAIILSFFNFARNSSQSYTNLYKNVQTLDTNNILMYLNNAGNLEDGGIGAWWNILKTSGKEIVFNQGLWLIGEINGSLSLALAQWESEYSPGPIINGQPAMLANPADSLRYRIYKINKGDDQSNPDYAEWPADFGAPVDNEGKPKIYGDQMLWCVYNAADPATKGTHWGTENLNPIPLEIQQLIYCRDGTESDEIDIFSNVIFIEYKIINKGEHPFDNAYVGFWTDIDFFEANKNFPGIDVNLQTGYCWSGAVGNPDTGEIPPTVGYTLIYGPLVESLGDNAVFDGRVISNHKNLSLSSFYPVQEYGESYLFGTSTTLSGTWNIANGYDVQGNPFFDSTSMTETKFPLSGDPVTGTGWLYPYNHTGGEAGFYLFSGSFTMATQDTQWIMLALVPGLGKDRFESIEMMRNKAEIIRFLPYDSLAYGSTVYSVTNIKNEIEHIIPSEVKLYQNYPNPFNPTTTIKYTIPDVGARCIVPLQIVIYDVLGNKVSTLVNENKSPGNYEVEFDAGNLASGIYFYRLNVDNKLIDIKKMILLK